MDFSRFDDVQLKYFYKLLLRREEDLSHSLSRERSRHYSMDSDKALDLLAESEVVSALKDLLLHEIGCRNVENN